MTARLALLVICASIVLPACGSDSPAETPSSGGSGTTPAAAFPTPDDPLPGPEHLTAEATDADIVGHLARAERLGEATSELAALFPDMDRARAYRIQMRRLEARLTDDTLAGWKLGYTRQLDPRTPIDPVFGHVLASQIHESGAVLPPALFVDGRPLIEAEVAVWLASDLPAGGVTREQVLAAVDRIAPAIEMVSARTGSSDASTNRAHDIADDVFHAGAVIGEGRFAVDEVDLASERARLEINGETVSEGRTATIMGRDPIEAVVWLANELAQHGHRLRAGQVVLTGTVLTPAPIGAGDTATVAFTTLGAVDLSLSGPVAATAP